ncbi:MAG: cytochrome c3 family protein [Candidatus Rokubacteria bacterium]|nr:cytochrome c3 family protein [Candidatus Rokubacteria bacterium]
MSGKMAVGVLGLVLLATLLFLSRPGGALSAAPGPVQPISFSHATHAGQYKTDCQYCHAGARRGAAADIPSVARCFSCHAVTAADRPEIHKLAGYVAAQTQMPWVRIFEVPEYVSFPHKSDIRAENPRETERR